MIQVRALRLVLEGIEFMFLGSNALKAYNEGARKRESLNSILSVASLGVRRNPSPWEKGKE